MSREVRIHKPGFILRIELDFKTACRNSIKAKTDAEKLDDPHCTFMPRNAPIRVTWALTAFEKQNEPKYVTVVTDTTTGYVGDRYNRGIANIGAPPGRYLFQAKVRQDNRDLVAVPARLVFWSKYQTNGDLFAFLINYFNWLIVGPLALIFLAVVIGKAAVRIISIKR